MITVGEIKIQLNAQAERVCHELLPHGKRRGRQWVCGSIHGEAGESTIVELDGSRTGVWADFASGSEAEKGDLFDLWMAVKNVGFREAFRAAKEFLGIRNPDDSSSPKRIYKGKPSKTGCVKFTETAAEKVVSYLANERKISRATIEAFRVGAKPDHDGVGGMDVAFPLFSPEGTLLNIKFLGIERTFNKEKNRFEKHSHQEADCPPLLFGWQAFEKDQKVAIITEGEIDCMTWHEWGYRCCLSVPGGAGNLHWIDWDWDNLEPFETIYLCFDNDEEGQKNSLLAAKRLGLHRCRIVKTPHKDSNECLQKGLGIQDAAVWLRESKHIEMPEIKTPNDYRDAIHRFFDPPEGEAENGLRTKIFGRRLLFRSAEMTLWSGHTSHGKSTLLNQIMLYAMMAGQRVAIGSFEVKGGITLSKMIMSLLLEDKPAFEKRESSIEWMTGKIWVFDFFGLIKRPNLLEMMRYAVMRHGVHHFVIDSLMKCDLNSEDYEAQRQFINELHCFAHEHSVHVHLVGHPRKAKDDDSPPGLMDVSGGHSVVGQPDNMIVIWRNKKKEEQREAGKMSEHQSHKEPDTIAFVNKQRLTGEEFREKLWFNRKAHRFTTHYGEGEPEFENFGVIQ